MIYIYIYIYIQHNFSVLFFDLIFKLFPSIIMDKEYNNNHDNDMSFYREI